MGFRFCSLLMLTAAGFAAPTAAFAAPPNELTAEERAAGWKLLFDGKTLNGWLPGPSSKPPVDAWTIDDGAIKARKGPMVREDLHTAANFGDFELEFEWKISPGGNSGVKYRVQKQIVLHRPSLPKELRAFERQAEYALAHPMKRSEMPADGKGEIYQVAFEYQVIDNDAHADAKRSKKSWAGALYQMLEPNENPVKPVGEWNQGRIAVKGDRIEHWLNGKKIVDSTLSDPAVVAGVEQRWGAQSPIFALLTKRPQKRGPIVLQNHNDEAWFRSIKIRGK